MSDNLEIWEIVEFIFQNCSWLSALALFHISVGVLNILTLLAFFRNSSIFQMLSWWFSNFLYSSKQAVYCRWTYLLKYQLICCNSSSCGNADVGMDKHSDSISDPLCNPSCWKRPNNIFRKIPKAYTCVPNYLSFWFSQKQTKTYPVVGWDDMSPKQDSI